MTHMEWIDALMEGVMKFPPPQTRADKEAFSVACFSMACAMFDEIQKTSTYTCDPEQGHWEMRKIHGPTVVTH